MANARMFEEMDAWRGYMIKTIDGLTDEQLIAVPHGFKNNILWNVGHVVLAQALFIYDMSGLESPLPKEFKEWFDNGTSPESWESTPDIATVKEHLASICGAIQADHAEGKFGERSPFDLGGISINTFDEAMAFNSWHEGIHLGIIMTLKAFV